MITPEIEWRLLRNIEAEAVGYGWHGPVLNGVLDYVHVLVSLPTTVRIAVLVKQIKGVSSHFVNETLQTEYQFKWQGSYGAFSVSRWDIDRIAMYMKRQKEHHEQGDLVPELGKHLNTQQSDVLSSASA